MSKKYFAEIKWTSGDVQTLRPGWTDAEAEEWLGANARHIQDWTIELGWQVIEDLLPAKTEADLKADKENV